MSIDKNIRIFAFADEAGGNIAHQIEAMKRNALNGIEIRGTEFGNVSDISLEQAKSIKSKLTDNGLCVWSIGSPIGKIDVLNGDFKAHLDKYKHTLDIAAEMECKNIRMFSFYIPHGHEYREFTNEVIYRLSLMAELAEPYKISLCHENEKGIYGDESERVLEILTEVPSLCGVFDPANYVQSGVDTLKAWELLKDHTKYMHIKDAMLDGRVVPSGCGNGNVAHIVSDFIARGGNAFTIEPHLTVFKGLAELERSGEESKVGTLYTYPDSDTAFDAACDAFKKLI